MPRCLIDASTTLAWLFNENGRGPALQQQFQNLDLVAPSLWQIEIVHVILKRERQKKLTQAEGIQYLQAIESLDVEIIEDPSGRTMTELAQTGRLHQLTSYDAVYFDLAVRLGIPLVTDDGNLQSAIKRVGIESIEPA